MEVNWKWGTWFSPLKVLMKPRNISKAKVSLNLKFLIKKALLILSLKAPFQCQQVWHGYRQQRSQRGCNGAFASPKPKQLYQIKLSFWLLIHNFRGFLSKNVQLHPLNQISGYATAPPLFTLLILISKLIKEILNLTRASNSLEQMLQHAGLILRHELSGKFHFNILVLIQSTIII